MLKYTVRKILAMIPKMFVISVLIFLGLQMLPGDAITRTYPIDMLREMTDAQINALREAAGLNDPVFVQYFRWLGKILQGDLGYTSSGSDVAQMLRSRLPFTMEIAFWGLMTSNILGILFGYLAALRQNTLTDYTLTSLSVVGISVPEFFFGISFILLFSMTLHWLPTGGRMDVGGTGGMFSRVKYLIMPVMTLSIGGLASMTRYTRSCMLDVMNRDYIKTARSKGLSEGTVYFKHGFRNAMGPVMTLVVFQLPGLVAGVVVIETVFNYPAVGTMLLDAIEAADMSTVMITTMIIAMLTLVASTLVDLVAAALDPRVRLE